MSPDTIDAMIAAGATAEVIAAAWKAEIAMQQRVVGQRRARDAERQRRHRESLNVTVTERDEALVTGGPAPLSPPLKVSPYPFKNTPPLSPHPVRRGTRLPNDFKPPPEWIAWATKKRDWEREDAAEEAECFTRYWQAKPGRDAVKLDWFKTWQNWVANSRRTSAEMTWDGGA